MWHRMIYRRRRGSISIVHMLMMRYRMTTGTALIRSRSWYKLLIRLLLLLGRRVISSTLKRHSRLLSVLLRITAPATSYVDVASSV